MTRGLPHLQLVCFGPATARLDGREPPAMLLWTKHLALLIYLALSPGRSRARDHLLGVFWPEKPEARARHSLNETLRRLRQVLGAERLLSRGDAVVLNDEALDVDVWRDDVGAEPPGTFLEGFVVAEAREFEEWAAAERRRYQARSVAALVLTGEHHLSASRFLDAAVMARRVLAVEPYHEPAVRLLLRAAALGDDVTGALAAFREFAERLEGATGEQPSRGLLALVERIRHQAWRPAPSHDEESAPNLIGREQVHVDAFDLVRAALADGPRTLLITGAPGMGRTRLLTECVERMALDGAFALRARPLPTDHDAPWSTLRLLLRAGLPQAPGLAATPPDALGVAAWLVPELAERYPARAPADSADVAAAMAAVLDAVIAERPIVLAIDDAHLSDATTLDVLPAVVERLAGRPLALIISAAEDAAPSPELLRLRMEIGERRRLRGLELRLDPLSVEDIGALLAPLAPWCVGEAARDRLARRLAFETGGNPFFAVTLLGGLRRIAHLRTDFTMWPRPDATFDTPLPITLPNLARAAVAARIAELDAECRTILSAASIGGVSLDLDLVATLSAVPRARVEERLASLERRHLIVFDGRRYAFAAPLIADAVRGECLTPGQRQASRRRAAAALAGREDLESQVLRVELLARVEPGPTTVEQALAVARTADAAGATRTARRALAAAERARG
jgi:DNA-binding SARP family transcriptional activator